MGAFFDSDIYLNNAEIAYWLGKDYRNQGIMSKVIIDFIDELFLKTTVHRIYARPFAYNQASSKVLENAGKYLQRRKIF
ncbi:GNAT family N-acetyltransferase [Enterococcus alishanensis]|uniref:GNAT family N-acetyltransferase n=1 Tax=Enterococcus alishanensis TaxID=1303817 RepID=UPI003CCE5F2D